MRDPDDWSDFLEGPKPPPSPNSASPAINGSGALNGAPLDFSRDRSYALAGLQRECAAVATTPPGGRNDRLNVAAYSLAGFIPQTLSEEEVVDGLRTAGLAAGLPEPEIATTLRSALNASKAQGNVRTAPPREDDWFSVVAANAGLGPGAVSGPDAKVANGSADAGVDPDDSSTGALGLEKIEGDFWSARESLTLIYESALSRLSAPWAVLAFCTARALTLVPPRWTLPPIIGGRGSLNWFAALATKSGGGKGSAHQVARSLIPQPIYERNLGSGEGMVGAFERPRGLDDPEGGLRESVMFIAEEVEQMVALGSRTGSTLMSTLRQAFSGETLGFTYVKKSPTLAAHTYRLTYVCGVQPALAHGLLGDAAGGTPQRFMWFPALDRRISRDYLRTDPWMPTLELPKLTDFFYDREIAIPQEVSDFIIDARVTASRGDGDPLESHAIFAREKLAFALAVLDGRTEMTLEDWELSGVAAAVSKRTREWVADHMTEAQRGAAIERGSIKAVEHVATERNKAIEAQRSMQVFQWVVTKVSEAGEEGMTKKQLKSAGGSWARGHVSPAVDYAAKQGLIRYSETTRRWTV